ncbi:MAG: FtsW/RodA/SpoVE family cell cycle protein, partial [Chloroflexi bacterium]|nr:FtsW/RodA/SpoVE family cell cycle protein [Chloroflexota bacterium]
MLSQQRLIRQNGRLARTDWGLLFIVSFLLITGLVMVYSASYGFALYEGGVYQGQPAYFFRRQVIFMFLGLAGMLICWRIDYHWYQRLATPILIGTMGVLIVMAALGRRWGFTSSIASSVQPVELAKIGAIIYIAVWLASRGAQLGDINL